MKIKMLFFNDRKKLSEEYMKWVEQEKVANCPFNVISGGLFFSHFYF